MQNNMDFIKVFENKLCEYTKFKYAICTDCCTNSLILSLKAKQIIDKINITTISIPKYTYMSVPMMLNNFNYLVQFSDKHWKCFYELSKLNIFDSATDFHENMRADYDNNSLVCVSFQQKKRLSLGRGGVILTDNKKYANLLYRLRYDGRNPYISDNIEINDYTNDIICGYHFYMEPDKAAKGILLINQKQQLPKYIKHSWKEYPDLTKLSIWNQT